MRKITLTFVVLGTVLLFNSLPAGAAAFQYCTLPADPAPGLPLMEECDVAMELKAPNWYKIRKSRGDRVLGAQGVICTDDGKGCTDPRGVIKGHLQKSGIKNPEWTCFNPPCPWEEKAKPRKGVK